MKVTVTTENLIKKIEEFSKVLVEFKKKNPCYIDWMDMAHVACPYCYIPGEEDTYVLEENGLEMTARDYYETCVCVVAEAYETGKAIKDLLF